MKVFAAILVSIVFVASGCQDRPPKPKVAESAQHG